MKSIALVGAIIISCFFALPVQAQLLSERLSGKILLQVESKGEAWYVNPASGTRFYLGRPDDAFILMRRLGLGITNSDLTNIPQSGELKSGKLDLVNQLRGRILLQVESKGEAWYVNPNDGHRYFLGRPRDAFELMRSIGLGVSNDNLALIPIDPESASPAGLLVNLQNQNCGENLTCFLDKVESGRAATVTQSFVYKFMGLMLKTTKHLRVSESVDGQVEYNDRLTDFEMKVSTDLVGQLGDDITLKELNDELKRLQDQHRDDSVETGNQCFYKDKDAIKLHDQISAWSQGFFSFTDLSFASCKPVGTRLPISPNDDELLEAVITLFEQAFSK